MYQIILSDSCLAAILKDSKKSPSLKDRLEELATNPLAKAKSTNINAIGEYYVNAGRWCILFNVNVEQLEVHLLGHVPDSYLHKVLTGRIKI